jgi:hypothetical protein
MMKSVGVALYFSLSLSVACSCASVEQGRVGRPSPSGTGKGLGPTQFRLAQFGREYWASTDDPAPCRFSFVLSSSPSAVEASTLNEMALRRSTGSDCTQFLARVAKELGFSGSLPRPPPKDRIWGSFVTLGDGLSRQDHPKFGLVFASSPAGRWTAWKLRFADGDGEVFLNLGDGIGEFSMHDEDAAVSVVTELAKVLLPQAG